MENFRENKDKTDKKKQKGKEKREIIKVSGQNSKKDTILRMFYNNSVNFAEIFNKAVFLKNRISADDLQEMDSVETGLAEDRGKSIALHQERDVIKKFCNDKELMLVAIENSTYVDYTIPIKVLSYCCINYNRQVMQIKDMRKNRRDITRGKRNSVEAETVSASVASQSFLQL